MKLPVALRCALAAMMLTVGTVADAQRPFATMRANRLVRVEARMAARGVTPSRTYAVQPVTGGGYETYTIEGADCRNGACRPTRATFRHTAVVPGSYRPATHGVASSGGSYGGSTDYLGYAATPPGSARSFGSSGGYGSTSQAANVQAPVNDGLVRGAACKCDGRCNCPDCRCEPKGTFDSDAEIDSDDGAGVFGYTPAGDDTEAFAYKPDEPAFAYRPAPDVGAMAGL